MEIPKTEVGWLKLRYKDLQKIAKQWNINPKSKKVDIVKALMNSDCTHFHIESCIAEQKENNINEAIENYSRRTMTRSRSSMSLVKNDKDNAGTFFSNRDKQSENRPQKKRRGGRQLLEAATSVNSQCVSVPIKIGEDVLQSKPLLEISNSISSEESYSSPKGIKQNTENTSKSTRGKLCLPQKIEELEHILDTDIISNTCGIGKDRGNDEIINIDDDKYYQRKGRKRRRMEENANLESATKHTEGFEGQTRKNDETTRKPVKRGRQKQLKQETISNSVDEDCVAIESEYTETMQNNDMISDIHNCSGVSESVQLQAWTNKRKTHLIMKKCATSNDTKPTHKRVISNDLDERDISNTAEENTMPVPGPLIRGSTFTLATNDNQDETNVSVSTASKGKSIGKRIMAASIKRGAVMSSTKKSNSNNGSSVKKTISKNSVTRNIGTPGSAYRNKFGVARKIPNFKNIHQTLFRNMESIDANQKRTLERGQKLIMSPGPRCAVTRKSLDNSITDNTNSTPQPRKSLTLPEKKPAFTVGSTNKKLASSATKPVVNRFGFKNRINKTENIVGQRQPPVNMEKKKEQERNIIQGVRMNKRFMLQMQMRKNTK